MSLPAIPAIPARPDHLTRFNHDSARIARLLPRRPPPPPPPPPPPNPNPATPSNTPSTPPSTPSHDPYTQKLKEEVRDRIQRVSALLKTETDPRGLDRLAAAFSKLAEQERILDGRPLPGSRRPREEKKQAKPAVPDPV